MNELFAVGDVMPLVPPLVLLVFAAFTLLLGVFGRARAGLAVPALLGVVVALGFAIYNFVVGLDATVTPVTLGGAFLADGLASAFAIVVLLGAGLSILNAAGHVERMRLEQPEFFPLILLSTVGGLVLLSAGDLIVLLLGLEILSLAVYALAAWRQGSRQGEEAGLKYFLLGAFASAFLVYGIALTYGATGRFDLVGIGAAIAAPGFEAFGTALLGGVFLLAGLGFKVAFAPFHQWTPDVYTGSPTPVTTFMSVVVKTAAFGALLRVVSVLNEALAPGPYVETFTTVIAVLVGTTLVVGNTGALLQSGVKRMLAYSAVAHAGYVGLAVLAGGPGGARAAAVYLLAYTVTNVVAFGVLLAVMDDDDRGDRLDRLAGMGYSRPWLAALLSLAMLGLSGFPPFAGFIGKVAVFQAVIAAGYMPLAVLGIATSVVAVVFYGRVVIALYLRDNDHPLVRRPVPASAGVALAIAAAGVVLLGLFPGWWLDLLARAPMLVGGA